MHTLRRAPLPTPARSGAVADARLGLPSTDGSFEISHAVWSLITSYALVLSRHPPTPPPTRYLPLLCVRVSGVSAHAAVQLRRRVQDVLTCALSITSESIAPIFLTSAVTGRGLALLRLFFDLAPLRRRWGDVQGEPLEFMIDETFAVAGVGTVVAGTIKKGRLNLQVPSCSCPLTSRSP